MAMQRESQEKGKKAGIEGVKGRYLKSRKGNNDHALKIPNKSL